MRTHQFSRRTFLRGVGVTMALPWMDAVDRIEVQDQNTHV
jgi:hypothetical protein